MGKRKKTDMKKLLLIVIMMMGFICCLNRDSFYTKKGGWDTRRIPLVKPYECVTTDRGANWLVHTPNYCDELINKINVIDGIIIGKCDLNCVKQNTLQQKICTWFFIIPDKRFKAEFKSEKMFLDSLSKITNQKVVFRNVDEVYQQFCDKDYLEWFPDEYKN